MSCIIVALTPEKSKLLILHFFVIFGDAVWVDLPLERRQNNWLNLDQLLFTIALLHVMNRTEYALNQ